MLYIGVLIQTIYYSYYIPMSSIMTHCITYSQFYKKMYCALTNMKFMHIIIIFIN